MIDAAILLCIGFAAGLLFCTGLKLLFGPEDNDVGHHETGAA